LQTTNVAANGSNFNFIPHNVVFYMNSKYKSYQAPTTTKQQKPFTTGIDMDSLSAAPSTDNTEAELHEPITRQIQHPSDQYQSHLETAFVTQFKGDKADPPESWTDNAAASPDPVTTSHDTSTPCTET
jgi:hypothetical protein